MTIYRIFRLLQLPHKLVIYSICGHLTKRKKSYTKEKDISKEAHYVVAILIRYEGGLIIN